MKRKQSIAKILIGITILVAGIVINTILKPYQTLIFPLDFFTIVMIATGLVILSGNLIKNYGSAYLHNVSLNVFPAIILVFYGICILLSDSYLTSIFDLFIGIFSWSFKASIAIVILQFLSTRFKSRVFLKVLLSVGIIQSILMTYELTTFLYFRLGAVEYAAEPISIWPYVLLLYLIIGWSDLVFIKLKKVKHEITSVKI